MFIHLKPRKFGPKFTTCLKKVPFWSDCCQITYLYLQITCNYRRSILLFQVKVLSKASKFRSSTLEVILGQDVLKVRRKFTGELPWQSVISIKLLYLIKITLWRGCSPGHLLYIFRTPFPKTPTKGCFWKLCFKKMLK